MKILNILDWVVYKTRRQKLSSPTQNQEIHMNFEFVINIIIIRYHIPLII